MCPTRKAALCRILLILVALAPIVFLVGGIAARRDVLDRSRASYPQMQNSVMHDAIAAKDPATSGSSPMNEDQNHVQVRSH